MRFSDVPSLQRFSQHASANNHCPITMDAYCRIRDLIDPVAPTPAVIEHIHQLAQVDGFKDTCAAIERSTRILWACAAATEHISPPMWSYTADYHSALDYFLGLGDLELMAVTKRHSIVWENVFPPAAAPAETVSAA